MKKYIGALALTLALGASVMSSAADLKTADGHRLPLGQTITVREGHESYIGKEINAKWDKEKAEKEIITVLRKKKIFPSEDKVHEELLAKQTAKLFETSRVGQIQFEADNAYHQALVLSIKLEEKDLAPWTDIIRALGKSDLPSSPMMKNGIVMLKDLRESMQEESAKKHYGHKKAGKTEYAYGGSFITTEQDGGEIPFYIFILASVDDKQAGLTAVYTNQATGRILEPILVKGAEALR